ncbi:helix-turn-helix transcriptional regulator [Geosporobacter ferrireducens]|uniref:HTH cro/C1-type domain-containing protein n=1 Tax=Geosporobacter ferrireducens TaxID=1424294 RepID=A0A1D8GN63_9FIRM|nr:helix-turn-helix transcriptional regulator [Geosporobacter ferrireducens]AOT72324.1 hypothetical protein Gferi_23915 [Geosporobacter ferrireducens]
MTKTHTIQEKTADEIRRQELSDFLKSRRARLQPEECGLPLTKKRRVPGLRREEVAQLAGVSVSWYTWLEQGRPISVSEQVIESLARVFRLDWAERRHFFLLTKEHLPHKKGSVLPVCELPPELQQVLDAFERCPAYILDSCWNIVGWNKSASSVFAEYVDSSQSYNNLIWILFTSPAQKKMLVDWDNEAKRCLAAFRASTQQYITMPELRNLIDDLKHASPHFNVWWKEYDIMIPHAKRKLIIHPDAGKLAFYTTTLSFPDYPQLNMMVYIPLEEEDTETKLRKLIQF